jgi:MFS family permease
LALGDVKSRILAAVYQLISPIGGIVCILTIEGFGRRGLMLASATGNAICMALIGGLGSQPENKLAMHGAIVFTFLFHFSHALGFAGIPFLYATEIAPSNLRTAINGISVGMFWAFTVLIAEITPRALETIGWRYFIIFAGFNVCIIPLIYFLFPETAGRSLEEMDEIFTKSKHVLDPVRVARSLRQLEDLPVQKGFCSEMNHARQRN